MAVKSKAAQDFIPIKEIRDGVVILKDGTIRMLLMASSVNLALKSADEQQAILMQFQSFLNSLEFSTQIFIQSRRLDIKPYLTLLDERLKEEMNELLKIQIHEYMGFVKTIAQSTNIMSKLFVIVVPYAPPRSVTASTPSSGGVIGGIFGKKKEASTAPSKSAIEAFEEARTQLEQRAGIISQGLSRTGVRVVPLGTEELTELYYRLFNPGEAEKKIDVG
ncbi:MAG: hypothetical protein COV32_02950 [Candidatus Yonathbacteria bacterium CG10_big_fil_rev_8_21_14_0_10_43_136]|uniref:TraC-like domain-containing protein n=2 Tax=Parcubacteria group TaxID=1794811 RepID=A0A2M7Q561_9BACT|nr:MAG: hypothetical protein AUK15_00020 [Candidatus Nomurabacteria bacterium CG2_30_43_9]PIQ35503.1 MAG: hypothetical protein COW60_03635 [Candidatus Yonathbacteria bacterium CG17_big_fil_post_rev_8_21_14_2_50_43_9]PIR40520.1 MAG: hypothetical protein COV32_02950 [Candidatus Yonathbacteria bacterium CG10_big_fil_rev_8_21_14_0_10_43_136]PIX57426.1 MAG: hypothetical protein COZ48_00720 [Candidatus Yonathbacteria bacterium CG_4_10_14_3_um_filter_43_12]PIY58533.1 MAG: hypothetical protein COY98_01